MDERLTTAAQHWSGRRSADGSRWWMHPIIHRHINRLVCGEEVDGPHQGFHRLIAGKAPPGGFRRALSVGCGTGGKEMNLLKAGFVETLDLFENGEFRRAEIEAKAEEHGVSNRVSTHIGDVFEQRPSADFDLVYWNNSLHHMFDASQALLLSYEALRTGGWLAMDDFVGPSRFQWPEMDLELARRVRELLPDRFLRNPRNSNLKLDREVRRPSIEHMMATDPTEAADSARILESIAAIFPAPRIIPTGGIIYHLALNDVLSNFDEEEDIGLLRSLLLLDETLAGSFVPNMPRRWHRGHNARLKGAAHPLWGELATAPRCVAQRDDSRTTRLVNPAKAPTHPRGLRRTVANRWRENRSLTALAYKPPPCSTSILKPVPSRLSASVSRRSRRSMRI